MNATIQGFAACLFRPDLGNEVVHGRIYLDRQALHFQSDTLHESIPLDNLVIEPEERGGRVNLTDPERPDLLIYTLDPAVLRAWRESPINAVRYQVRQLREQTRFSRAVKLSLCLAGAAIVLTWIGSWTLSFMVRSLADRVPAQWESKFGESEIKDLQEEEVLSKDTNAVQQLAALAAPLTRVVSDGKTQFQFHIMENPMPNAFALPGGHVVVTTGMLDLVEDPNELLGVLAHEFAHVTRKHYARKMISSAGPMLIFGVFLRGRAGVGTLLTAGSAVMIAQGFSQEYETEADDVGWQTLVRANIDPNGMVMVFRRLQTWEANNSIRLDVPQAFSSHPAMDKRIARLESKCRRLPPNQTFLQITNAIPKLRS